MNLGRPIKQGIDYFPHDVHSGKTMFTLEKNYGNNGYAVWFKTLEVLGEQADLYFDCRDTENWEYLVAKCNLCEVSVTEILDKCANLNAIDRELWKHKVIWCQNFTDRVSSVFKKRASEIPQKPEINGSGFLSQAVTESTQRKGKESKEKERKEEETDPPPSPDQFSLYGIFKNVQLTEEQYQMICDTYQDYKGLINKVSTIMEKSKGREFTDHYGYLLNIALKDDYKVKVIKEPEPDPEPINPVPMPEEMRQIYLKPTKTV
jgi:hypothetical protein